MSNCGCAGGGAGGGQICTCFTANDCENQVTYVDFNGLPPDHAFISTPDSAAVSIVGDLELEMEVALDDWTPPGNETLIAKWLDSTDRSYRLDVQGTTGNLVLFWSNDGSALLLATSTAAVVVADGTKIWVKATLDVDNGAAGRDIQFFTSANGFDFVQLGATVTQAGITSIFDSTQPLEAGNVNPVFGNVYSFKVRNGIDGSIVASFDVRTVEGAISGTQTPSTTTQNGTVWTLNGSAWTWEGSCVTARGNGSISHPFNFVPGHIPNPRPCGQITRVGVVQTILAATDTAIIFNTDGHPFNGNMTNLVGAPTRLTAPVAGKYLVGGFVVISNPGTYNISVMRLRKNGLVLGDLITKSNQDSFGGTRIMLDSMTLINLVAGDYIELFIFSSLSVDITFNNTDFDSTYDCPAYLWAQWMTF